MLRLLLRKLQAHSLPLPVARLLSSSSPSSSSAEANPALVLTTLRSHGVPDDLCQSVVANFPRLLTLNPANNLSPKLSFLRSEGFSGSELADILLQNPFFLNWSLDRCVSSVNFLKSILSSKEALLRVLKRTNKPFTPILLANINLLKDYGLPEAMILKLLFYQPRSLTCTPAHFVDALDYLKKLNVRPTSTAFVVAVGMLSYMSRSTFRRKLEIYKEFGWTEEQVLTMFKQQPTTLAASDQAIRKKVMYYRDTVGWGPEFFCKYSWVMTMSMEKRIIPRCAVLNVLMSNGLLKRNAWSASKFTVKEETFEENFVNKYEKTVPEVVMAYEGKIKFSGWDWMKDTKNQPEASES